jgi:small subunit ribosomal protein S17
MTETKENTNRVRKAVIGIVTSDKSDKTIVVRVDRRVAHPKYKKVIVRSKNFHAHDENNEARIGDRVQIVESRPLSALKRWQLQEILTRAIQD